MGVRRRGTSAADAARKALDFVGDAYVVGHSVGFDLAFLEEAPFAQDVVAAAEAPWSAVGLFLGDGMHGGEDFDVLVSTAPTPPAISETRNAT